MRLRRVVRDHDHPGAGFDERPQGERVLAEDRSSDAQDKVPAGQGRAKPGAVGREEAGKERVVLRETGASAERLLPDRAAQSFRQPDECGPGVGVGSSRAGDDRWRLGAFDQRRQLGDRLLVGCLRPERPLRRSGLGVAGGLEPVVHRDDDERRPSACHCFVPGAVDRPGNVPRQERQIDADGIVARQVLEPPREKGLQREMSPVLLPDEND